MPRTATTENGAIPPERRGRMLSVDPLDRRRRVLSARAVAPAEEAEAPEAEEEAVSSGLDGQYLPESTGSAVGAVGRPQMLPDTIEAIGPSGEMLVLKRDERGQYVTINSDVPPPPISAEVDHPLLQQLRSRTNKPAGHVQRAPAYNHRLLYYMRPDGEIVSLQGDPGNRAYYEDKGFVVLRPDEERMWLRGDPSRGIPAIRRAVIVEQRRRAVLVTTIRSIAKRNPAVEMTGDLSITPTEELEEMLTMLRSTQGINFRLIEARQRAVRDDLDDEASQGMEVGSGAVLERKMARSLEQQRIGGLHRRPVVGASELSGTGQMMAE
jgi:hypothetical protein